MTKILFRRQSIVGAAAQREIVDGRWASSPVRMLMVELQSGLLPATLAASVDVRAARFVSLPDGTADFCRNIPTVGRWLRCGVSRASRGLRRGVPIVRRRLRSGGSRAGRGLRRVPGVCR